MDKVARRVWSAVAYDEEAAFAYALTGIGRDSVARSCVSLVGVFDELGVTS